MITVEWINGLKLGIEHITSPDEDDDWLIAVDILFIRLCFWKITEE